MKGDGGEVGGGGLHIGLVRRVIIYKQLEVWKMGRNVVCRWMTFKFYKNLIQKMSVKLYYNNDIKILLNRIKHWNEVKLLFCKFQTFCRSRMEEARTSPPTTLTLSSCSEALLLLNLNTNSFLPFIHYGEISKIEF